MKKNLIFIAIFILLMTTIYLINIYRFNKIQDKLDQKIIPLIVVAYNEYDLYFKDKNNLLYLIYYNNYGFDKREKGGNLIKYNIRILSTPTNLGKKIFGHEPSLGPSLFSDLNLGENGKITKTLYDRPEICSENEITNCDNCSIQAYFKRRKSNVIINTIIQNCKKDENEKVLEKEHKKVIDLAKEIDKIIQEI